VTDLPTAVQAVEETQETLDRRLKVAPLGLGVDCTDQAVPFQFSARVRVVPALLT